MKILMLGWELPPDNSGGLGVACYQLCKSLASSGMDIDFVLPYLSRHSYDFMNVLPNIKTSNLALIERFMNPQVENSGAYESQKYSPGGSLKEWMIGRGTPTDYEAAVERMVLNESYDIIHAHDWMTFRAALRAKQTTNCPLIVHVHSVERDRSAGLEGNPMVREIEGLTFNLADRIIAVSQLTKNTIAEDYGIPLDKIEVLHNSIDLADVVPLDGENAYHFLSEMKQLGWKVVVNIGRHTGQKGLPNFMHAAQAVAHKLPKTIFLFVGSGEQTNELIELAADLGISQNVIFAGFQRGKKWRDAYAIADLFVMPSVSEPFGLTPYEAIGYGTPALISKQSGISEVLSNCLKVDFWDVDEMANQIAATLQYDGLRQELHANSLIEYQALGWEKTATMLIDLYKSHLLEPVT